MKKKNQSCKYSGLPKRLTALLLCCMMAVTMVPSMVFAEEVPSAETQAELGAPEAVDTEVPADEPAEPTEEPAPTEVPPTEEPTEEPVPTEAPAPTEAPVEPTEEPAATEAPTPEPSSTPEPTEAPDLGDGTEAKPFVAATADELVTAAAKGGFIQLTTDIALTDTLRLSQPVTILGDGYSVTAPSGLAAIEVAAGVPISMEQLGIFSETRSIVMPEAFNENTQLSLKNVGLYCSAISVNPADPRFDTEIAKDSIGISLWECKDSTVMLESTTIVGFQNAISVAQTRDVFENNSGLQISVKKSLFKAGTALQVNSAQEAAFTFEDTNFLGINTEKDTTQSTIKLDAAPYTGEKTANNTLTLKGCSFQSYINSEAENAVQNIVDATGEKNEVVVGNSEEKETFIESIASGSQQFIAGEKSKITIVDAGGLYAADTKDFVAEGLYSVPAGEAYTVTADAPATAEPTKAPEASATPAPSVTPEPSATPVPTKAPAKKNATKAEPRSANDSQKVSMKKFGVAPGVTEFEQITNNDAGDNQMICHYGVITPSANTKLVASGADARNPGAFGMATITEQAANYEKLHPGEKVVMGTNGDFFDMTTGQPYGLFVVDGVKYSDAFARPYFARLKDGGYAIRDWDNARGDEQIADVADAVGGAYVVVRDGKMAFDPNDGYLAARYPHSAVGLRADGTIVTYVGNGIWPPRSCGESYIEISEKMIEMGCVTVLSLDGGGSATFDSRREGESRLSVRNEPKDGGERQIGNSLLVVSTAKASGVFDHATLSPSEEIYTPGSAVQFSAIGVDSSGSKVDLPAGVTWEVADATKGTIDAAGKFTASAATGTVTVNMKSGSTVIGTTTIEIQQPDAFAFANDEVSLGFGKESNLGLIAKYKGRVMQVKDGDIKWTVSDPTMGSFNGNIFTASESATVTGTITATSVFDEKVQGHLTAVIGLLPKVVMDFEDGKDVEGNNIPAVDYWASSRVVFDADKGAVIGVHNADGSVTPVAEGATPPTTTLLNGHYCNFGDPRNVRGGTESVEIVNIGSGEPVRFGNNSLKINYDFSNWNGIEGACVGFSQQTQQIEGSPTAIGMWVYAPEGTPNLWLRTRVRTGDGMVATVNFTQQMTDSSNTAGINWEGWKYVEADLSNLTGPFSLIGGETIRVMRMKEMGNWLLDGTKIPDSACKGSLYFDNLRFVYGSNKDDTAPPIISSTEVNGQKIADGAVIETNKISVSSYFHDNVGADEDNPGRSPAEKKEIKNTATGIDAKTVYLFIDGKDATDRKNFHREDTKLQLDQVTLSNGVHTLKVAVRDGFGNETTSVYTININAADEKTPISLAPAKDNVPKLNTNYAFEMTASALENIQSLTATVNVSDAYAPFTVTGSDQFDVTSTYDKKTGALNITATKKAGATAVGAGTVAVISCKVPYNMPTGSNFVYGVSSGSITPPTAQDEAVIPTFTVPKTSVPVIADYVISVPDLITGDLATLTVTNADGSEASKVNVYSLDEQTGIEELIGKTNYKGFLDISNYCEKVSTYNLFAEKSGQFSFAIKGQSYTGGGEDANPYNIMNNATADSSTSKSVTWMANPLKTKAVAQMQIATKADFDAKGESAYTDYTGKTVSKKFAGSPIISENRLVRINSVKAEGLKPGVAYVYRVGDGATWSKNYEFTLDYKGIGTDIFLFADDQTMEHENVDRIIQNIVNSGVDYELGIQTGDAVDNAAVYANWDRSLKVLGPTGTTDILHSIGNHEQYGDPTADIAAAMFNLSDKQHYSVEYGNTYIATISFTESPAQLKADLEWLKEDAKKSKAQWKLLVTHTSPYFTNPTMEGKFTKELLPKAAQEAGIDVVLSGHDHTYVRTEALYDGAVDNEKGIPYFICGSTGGKSYPVVKDPAVPYAIISQDYDGLYMTLSTTDSALSITARSLDGTVVDSFTKEKTTECSNGHTFTSADGRLTCSKCGYNRSSSDYFGLATDKASGKTILFANGEKKTGWQPYGEDMYFFGTDGLGGKAVLAADTSTCTKKGAMIYSSEYTTEQYTIPITKVPGHYYEDKEVDGKQVKVCSKCGWTQKNLADCQISLKYASRLHTGSPLTNTVTIMDGDYKLISSTDYLAVVASSYKNNVNPGTATVTVKSKDVFNGSAAGTEARGSYIGQISANFEIRENNVAKLNPTLSGTSFLYTGKEIKPSVAIAGLKNGTHYTVTYKDNIKVGTATAVITGKESYRGTIEKTFTILDNTIKTFTLDKTSYSYTGKEIRPVVTVSGLKNGTDYTVAYKDNIKAGTASVTVTGKGKYRGTVTKNFKIVSKKISEFTVNLSRTTYAYNGKAQKPSVSITGLKNGTDYTLSYKNNIKIGTATVTVTGKGGFTGYVNKSFYIKDANLAKHSIKLSGTSFLYTGKAISPTVSISGLKNGTDYTVKYSNNIKAGTATATVTGKGYFKGSVKKTYTIKTNNISSSVYKVSVSSATYYYTGKEIKPSVNISGLKNGTDYKVAYSNNIKIGTATVTFTGMGAYTGSVKKTFPINDVNLTKHKISLAKQGYAYTGKSIKPEVTVSGLTEGRDFIVSYSNNVKVGTATVLIAGVGKCTGSTKKTFKIYSGTPVKTPTGFKGSVSNSTIRLSWKAVSGVKYYALYNYNPTTKKYSKIAITDKTSYSIPGNKANTSYYFAVRGAYDALGEVHGSFTSKLLVRTKSVVASSVSIPSKLSLEPKKTAQLIPTVSPKTATNKAVSWSTSNKKVATVSSKGVVTGVGVGVCTITVKTVTGKTDTCTVTVNSTRSVSVKAKSTLTVLFPKTGKHTWTSSDTKIATVDSKGVVTGAGVGSCKVTVKSSYGYTAFYTVSVNMSKSVALSDKTFTLTARFPSGTTTWSSSDTKVATVNSKTGVVTTLKTGTCKITAKNSAGTSAYYTLKVGGAINAESVKLSKSALTLAPGKTETLTATYRPATVANAKITWTSSDPKIATVMDGKVTGVAPGNSIITASMEGGAKAECVVVCGPHAVISGKNLSLDLTGLSCKTVSYAKGEYNNKDAWDKKTDKALYMAPDATVELANFESNTTYTFCFVLADGATVYAPLKTGETAYNAALAEFPSVYFTGNLGEMTAEKNEIWVDCVYTDATQSFTSAAEIKYQGSYSMNFDKKNYNMKLYTNREDNKKYKVDLGLNGGKQNKYTLKANYTDYTQSRNIVSANVWAQVVASRENLDENIAAAPNYGAVDGYPVRLYLNGKFHGVYTMNIPKDSWMMGMEGDKTTKEAMISSGLRLPENRFYAPISLNPDVATPPWEIESCSTGDKTYADYKWVEDSFNDFVKFVMEKDGAEFHDGLSEYADVDAVIDYVAAGIYLAGYDNTANNMLWSTFDGKTWIPTLYDLDGTLGYRGGTGRFTLPVDCAVPVMQDGKCVSMNNEPIGDNQLFIKVINNFSTELSTRYRELRETILYPEYIVSMINGFKASVPATLYNQEQALWPESPSTKYNYDYPNNVVSYLEARQALIDDRLLR